MSQVLIMGVLNLTPDSFSDGGQFIGSRDAATHAQQLIDDGADIVDLGAESTRPGSKVISEAEEWRRLGPVLLEVLNMGVLVSVDTYKPGIMRRAVDAGAQYINDVRGGALLRDDELTVLAKTGISYVAMHGSPGFETMQIAPLDAERAVQAVDTFFAGAHARLLNAGFAPSRIWLDPGIGFGKNDRANLALLRLSMQRASAYNLTLGVSRKSFIGRLLGIESPRERDQPAKMLELGLMLGGVKMIRTHDVKALARIRALM